MLPDELSDFQRSTIDALRQPLKEAAGRYLLAPAATGGASVTMRIEVAALGRWLATIDGR